MIKTFNREELHALQLRYEGSETLPAIVPVTVTLEDSKHNGKSIELQCYVPEDGYITLDICQLVQALGLSLGTYEIYVPEFDMPTDDTYCVDNYAPTRGLTLPPPKHVFTNACELPRYQEIRIPYRLMQNQDMYIWVGPTWALREKIEIDNAGGLIPEIGTVAVPFTSGTATYLWDDAGHKLGEIAHWDNCHRMFLRWTDRLGATRCMYFDYLPQYTEHVEKQYLTHRDGSEDCYAVSTRGKWELTRRALTDEDYEGLESLFVARDVELYDAVHQTWTPVKVSDDYVERYYKKEKQLLKLQLTVEEARKHTSL